MDPNQRVEFWLSAIRVAERRTHIGYPWSFQGRSEALKVLQRKVSSLRDAITISGKCDCRHEAIEVAAMALRFLIDTVELAADAELPDTSAIGDMRTDRFIALMRSLLRETE